MFPCGIGGMVVSPSWFDRISNFVLTFLPKLDRGCFALAFHWMITSARSIGRPVCVLTTILSVVMAVAAQRAVAASTTAAKRNANLDRKSTRLNSSHLVISYAVFC